MYRHRRIDMYVLRELIPPTLLGLFLYTFVLMMNHFFLVAEKSLSKNLSIELTLRMFAVGIPKLLVLSIPMAVLLGTMIALGRLSADHEWIALQSAGRGPSALLRPVIIHGLIGALVSFLIYSYLVPQTHYAFRSLRGQILFSTNLASDLKPRVFYELPDNSVLFVDDIRPGDQGRLQGVLLIQPGKRGEMNQLIVAQSGALYPASDGSGALIVDLYDGEARFYRSDDPASYRLTRFARAEGHRFEPPAFVQALLSPPQKVVQDLPLGELWREVGESRRERDAVTKPRGKRKPDRGASIVVNRRHSVAVVEFHQRIALPVTCLLFAILALPLGITNVRSGKGAGFAMSLVVILVYRIVFVLARNQAVEGGLPAALGPWVANIVIFVWAVIAFYRLRGRNTRSSGLLTRGVAAIRNAIARRGQTRRKRGAEADVDEERAASELAILGGTPRRFVGRLDRYIGMAYLRVLGFAVASAYLIFGLIELQALMDDVLRSQQSPALVANYFKFFAPTVLHIVLPIACLVGAIVAVTMLSRTGELVAIKASGVGMRRAVLPIVLLTVVLCGLLYYVQDHITPSATRTANTIRDQIEGRAPRTHGLPVNGRWSFGPEGRRLYHYKLYSPGTQEFRELSIFGLDRDEARVVDHRYIKRAQLVDDSWIAEDGWYRRFGPDEYEIFSGEQRLALAVPGDLVTQQQRLASRDLPDQMSLSELTEQIEILGNSGYDITKLRMAYYGKFSQATAPLVMVLLGLPFAFKVGRRGSLYGVGVALILVLAYWTTFAIFNALGLQTMLSPAVAAWGPNVLFGMLGSYLMLYVRT